MCFSCRSSNFDGGGGGGGSLSAASPDGRWSRSGEYDDDCRLQNASFSPSHPHPVRPRSTNAAVHLLVFTHAAAVIATTPLSVGPVSASVKSALFTRGAHGKSALFPVWLPSASGAVWGGPVPFVASEAFNGRSQRVARGGAT